MQNDWKSQAEILTNGTVMTVWQCPKRIAIGITVCEDKVLKGSTCGVWQSWSKRWVPWCNVSFPQACNSALYVACTPTRTQTCTQTDTHRCPVIERSKWNSEYHLTLQGKPVPAVAPAIAIDNWIMFGIVVRYFCPIWKGNTLENLYGKISN